MPNRRLLSADAPFPARDLRQALIHVAEALFEFLFVCITAAAFVVGFFTLFFVRL